MKKIKLLTSLSSLAIIGTSVPIVATSCSNEEYTVSGFNWDKTPTVGVTSSPNQWYIMKGNQTIASYDNCKNVTDLKVNDKTSKELGFVYDEDEEKGYITPTQKGPWTLALDFTLDNGTKFTVSTTVVVTSNYPWTVSAKDNCKATEEGKRVTITDTTKAATLNIKMDSIPATAEYIIKAAKQNGTEVTTLKFDKDNGVLTIPENTFTAADAETVIICTITVKNGLSTLGETLYLNITTAASLNYDDDNGLMTFSEWTNDDKTGILDFGWTSHFPAQNVPDGGINFAADDTKAISDFVYNYVTAGMIAEAMVDHLLDYYFPTIPRYAEIISEALPLTDATISWSTKTSQEGEKAITFSIIVIFNETAVFSFYGKLTENEDGIKEYTYVEGFPGSSYYKFTSTEGPVNMWFSVNLDEGY